MRTVTDSWTSMLEGRTISTLIRLQTISYTPVTLGYPTAIRAIRFSPALHSCGIFLQLTTQTIQKYFCLLFQLTISLDVQ